MAHPLNGSRTKIRQAGKHLKTLDREVLRFVELHPYRLAVEVDGKTSQPVVRVRAEKVDEPPPLEFGVVVGDVAHNLRSALDHLICDLATLGKADCASTQFPICDTKDAFEREVRKHRLDGLTDRQRAMIERIQPYHRRNAGQALWLLREFSNADKHRVINPTTLAATFQEPIFSPPSAVLKFEATYKPRVTMKDGAEYARITKVAFRKGSNVHVQFDAPYRVIFGEAGRHEVNVNGLRVVRDHVRRIVNRFTGEFPI